MSNLLRVFAAMTLVSALAVVAPNATASAASNVPVGVSGSHCYAGGRLVFFTINVETCCNTRISGSTGSIGTVSAGRHTFTAQAFCKYGFVVGAGRSGQSCGWVYSSGYQPRIYVALNYWSPCR